MRALRLCGGPAVVVKRLGVSATSWTAVCSLGRRQTSNAATAAVEDNELDVDDRDEPVDERINAELHDAAAEGAFKPLVAKLLPYVYAATAGAEEARLAVPHASRPVQRMKRMLQVSTAEELHEAVASARLETAAHCTDYVNLVVAYMRHEGNLQQLENASSSAMQHKARVVREQERGCHLTPEEQHVVLEKACALVEQRRTSLLVATRLLRHRWPAEFCSKGGMRMNRYLTDLVRNWAAEELQAGRLTPRDARAVLLNCAFAFKPQIRQARYSASSTSNGSSRTDAIGGSGEGSWSRGVAATKGDLASLIGSLATTAVSDVASPREAEGIISVMRAVHLSGCPAPMSFWNAMVRRVVQLNEAFDSPLMESTPADNEDGAIVGGSHRGPRSSAPAVGHFFSGLTTRQLYRFLEVLRLVRWSGDVAVLHRLAEQTLRNVAFELEATPSPQRSSSTSNGEGGVDAAQKEGAASTVAAAGTDDAVKAADRQQARRDVTQRIRHVADMSPREFVKLLTLASDLRVPFGVSATRVSEELMAPLVPHLATRDLITLLQIVRHTQSQSVELLQAVMRRLIEMGPAIPYALTLSKSLVRAAGTTPDLFAELQMDEFVHFFLDLVEAQFSLCRPTEVSSLADLLYTLGRRYDASSPPGRRIRAVVNLLCAHMDRLLQLHVIPTSIVEPLLEATVLLRMRPLPEVYPAVQDLLHTRTTVVEKQQAYRTMVEERRARAVEDNVGSLSGRLGPRWEDVPEVQLPQISKAAIGVYGEVAYMFERMVVVKAKLGTLDFSIFEKDMEKAGLFSILHGVRLYQQGHLEAQVHYTTPAAKAAASTVLHSLPRWIEKSVSATVQRRLARCGISARSSNEEVLRVLGHVHCDAAKVDAVVALVVQSPLQLLKHQRPLWIYVNELARRFGSEETQQAVATYLSKSLF